MSKPKRIAPTRVWKQLQLRIRWPDQQSYELIRPVVLFGQPAHERALETGEPIRTIYRHVARFTAQGLPGRTAAATPPPPHTLPSHVRQMILELKAEHLALSTNEIATICYVRLGRRSHATTIKRVLAEGPPPITRTRRFPPFHEITDPAQRRIAIIRLHSEGWNKKSIAAYLQTTRTTVYDTLQRWAHEGVGGLYAKSRARKPGGRKVMLRTIATVRRLQRNPHLGAYRIRAALRQEGIRLSPRTCGRILAANHKLYQLEPPTSQPREKKPMPFAASRRHQYWSVDIRYIDVHQLGGGNIYSITILENYSRAILVSAVTRSQDLTAYLIVLYAAIRHHGCPEALVSDGGSVFRAKQAMEIYRALGIAKEQIEKRQAWQNYIESNLGVFA